MYAPKIRLTWFLERDYIQQFLCIFMPVLFIAVGSVVNSLTISGFKNTDYSRYADYLTRTRSGRAHARVHGPVDLQVRVDQERVREKPVHGDGALQRRDPRLDRDPRRSGIRQNGGCASSSTWPRGCSSARASPSSATIFALKKLTWHIKKHNKFTDKPCTDKEKGKERPITFLGRPGTSGKNTKGSDVSLDDWAQFWDVDDEKKIAINPKVEKIRWRPAAGKNGKTRTAT